MKTTFQNNFFKKAILGVSLILAGIEWTNAALIAGWDFNTQVSGAAPTPIAADFGSGYLDLSQLANESSDANIGATTSGTTVNLVGGDTKGKDFFVQSGAGNIENGKSIIFSLSTSGYQNILLTYATYRSGTGFTSQQWSYSTDGLNYTSFGSAILPPGTTSSAYAIATVDFSGASLVNNDSTVYFEVTLTGATSSSGSDHFDNIQFNASPVPEPATWGAMSGLGLLGLCGLRAWREQKQKVKAETLKC